ncbi:MAG: outer membrane beta-barrel protein [Sphingobacteriaceae bacterium]|nr:outer membrane beta-barrel protein [Sphingobacteriaceae bacterium]
MHSDSSRVSIDTLANLPKYDNGYISLSAQHRIKWWGFQTYLVGMYQTFSGKLKDEDINSETYNYYVNMNNEFYFAKDFKIAVWAGLGSAFQHGPQTYHARSAVHISIDKAFFNKKLNVTLALHDVLYKDYFSYTTTYSDQSAYWYDRMDTPQIPYKN